jgi:hypothetical protein
MSTAKEIAKQQFSPPHIRSARPEPWVSTLHREQKKPLDLPRTG